MSIMNKYAIFDLDNCLSDDRERIALIDWSADTADKRYAAYHAACYGDEVGNFNVFEAWTINTNCCPIFLTARPTSANADTERWIVSKLGWEAPFIMIMRNPGDHRPSRDVKEWQLDQLLDPNQYPDITSIDQIRIAVDDRQDIVDMYKSRGIDAYRIAIHDQCAYNPPNTGAIPRQQAIVSSIEAEPQRDAGDLLNEAAKTFQERTAQYGTLYKASGPIYAALFPDGLALKTPKDFVRFGLLNHTINKIARYARAMPEGGHEDSARDLTVYAAMLQEMTK